jgi:hypothetical protein
VENLHLTPVQAGVLRLYHYEAFNACNLTLILRDQKIHSSRPESLNDPWDCRPALDSERLKDPETLRETIDWYQKICPQPIRNSLRVKWEKFLLNSPEARAEFTMTLSDHIQAILFVRGIYCLTPNPESTEMWSHYADNHRGICLEFDVDNALFRMARSVVYCEKYPRWLPQEITGAPERVMDLILTKADNWAYEREFRIVNGEANGVSDTQDEFFRLPRGALKSVIVGCLGNYAAVRKVVREYAPDLPIHRVVRNANHYRLEVVSPTAVRSTGADG